MQDVIGTAIATNTPLMATGVDSLGATEFQKLLGRALSAEIPSTLLFDHPSITGIAQVLLSQDADTGSRL
jgi:hypothetical protein